MIADVAVPTVQGGAKLVDLIALRALSIRLLARMYMPEERSFVFRMRRDAEGLVTEGNSRRYTAIVLIGLASEPLDTVERVLGRDTAEGVCDQLISDIGGVENLGDVALTLWAARLLGHTGQHQALERLSALRPANRPYPTVELAWALSALSAADVPPPAAELRERLADRLLSTFNPASSLFPHMVGGGESRLRGHVCCFADLVYPVQALSHYYSATRNGGALEAARRCAEQFCALQGPGGQWWWHYDVRTGRVVEGYPVYSVHQDAMAPMALLALQDAGGDDFRLPIQRGLEWLYRCPELGGDSIIDAKLDILWRKVARREPRKLSRRLQAAASRLHRGLRVPGLDAVLPPVSIDYECRPYHLGWLLHAFGPERARTWSAQPHAGTL